MLPVRTILFATDFSPQSDRAYRFARALARDTGARLVAVHVIAPPPFVTYREVERATEAADGYRDELEARLRALSADCQLREGDPAAEILAAADEVGSDVIVMGTHGRTGMARVLLGSVAEAVLRRAPCPVLTVKEPAGEAGGRGGRGREPVHTGARAPLGEREGGKSP